MTDPIARAADAVFRARRVVALTGAGISVESGIPDFRSPGGLWTVFDPFEYATLDCFEASPEKSWRLFREIGRTVADRRPNPAHTALAALERKGHVAGVITQNIDGLHQASGSLRVHEIHGDLTHLECRRCGAEEPMLPSHLEAGAVPVCAACQGPLKPRVVLFGEPVRDLAGIRELVDGCDVMLVVGTSALVAPAATFPLEVLEAGGSVIEVNLEPTDLTRAGLGPRGVFVAGPAGRTMPAIAERVLARTLLQ